jgi:hypothetical protein
MNDVAAPEWESVAHDVLCPLCEYNLRGLTEARCPECGYRFDWADVLDPKARVHPYLFEHHPERNVRSFFRTLWGSLNPLRFWRSLSPMQPSRPRRLAAYWVLTSLLMLFVVLADWGRATAQYWAWQGFNSAAWGQTMPPLTGSNWWRMVWNLAREVWHDDRGIQATLQFALFWLAWPWLTLGILMIFRASMRKAKVKTGHVVRCLVYTFDIGVWPSLAAVAAVAVWAILGPDASPGMTGWRIYSVSHAGTYRTGIAACLALLILVRLWLAYRLYMRFDHAFWTILSSQVILMLAVLQVLLLTDSPWRPF